MADPNQTEVQVGFEIDLDEFQQGLSRAEQLAQEGVQRLNAISQQQQQAPTVISTPAGATAPPLPPPTQPDPQQQPLPPTQPAPTSGPVEFPGTPAVNPIAAAWEEFKKIQQYSESAPDVAMAALSGRGGLTGRLTRGAIADPDSAGDYQDLLNAIKELSKSIKDGIQQSERGGEGGGGFDPASGLLRFMRGNALLQTGTQIAGQFMGGNAMGGVGSLLGGAIGLIGGPAGMMAGSTIGGMLGSGLGSFLGGAGEAQQYSMLTADIAGRFGTRAVDPELSINNVSAMNRSAYGIQETAQLFDQLRQNRVISQVDDSSKELVESIQALTRATGQNTEAVVQQYSSYRQSGGRDDANTYMAQMIAGAVSVGMRQNLQEYSEMVGSARMQLVYRSGIGDTNDGALKAIQGTLSNLMGGNSRTSELLRDNPMMAQQMLGGFLQTGAARAYSYDSVAMQLAGVDRSRTTEGFISPDQQVQNAIARQRYVANQVLSQGLGTMGYGNVEQLQQAARANPNLVQDLFTNRNPNTQQAGALQDMLNMQLQAQYGREPTGQERQLSLQMLQAYLQNGSLTPQTVTGDGKSLADLINESQKSEGQQAREASAKMHDETMKFMGRFADTLTQIQTFTGDLLTSVNRIADGISKFADFFPSAPNTAAPQTQALGTATGTSAQATTSALAQVATGQITREQAQALPGVAAAASPQQMAELTARVSRGEITSEQARAIAQHTTAPTYTKAEQARTGLGGLFDTTDRNDFVRRLLNSPVQQPGQSNDIHAAFHDTPHEGVLATNTYNTFQFSPGDRVFAFQENGMRSAGQSGPSNVSISVQLTVPAGADMEWMRSAGQVTGRALADEFSAQWDKGRYEARNQPRINDRNY